MPKENHNLKSYGGNENDNLRDLVRLGSGGLVYGNLRKSGGVQMKTFFYSCEYLEKELANAEQRVEALKTQIEHAKIREFYWNMQNALAFTTEAEAEEFYQSPFTISFLGKTIQLYNGAEVFGAIEDCLKTYMDDEGIEWRKEK